MYKTYKSLYKIHNYICFIPHKNKIPDKQKYIYNIKFKLTIK